MNNKMSSDKTERSSEQVDETLVSPEGLQDEGATISYVEPVSSVKPPAALDGTLEHRIVENGPDATVETAQVTRAEPGRFFKNPPKKIGEYHIHSELGRGAMGVVFLATHLRLNRQVAIKMILAGGFEGTFEHERFVKEAQAVAALQHPNIVQLHEISEYEGLPYIVIEYVQGMSLQQYVRQQTLEPRLAAKLTVKIARAMELAHGKGILHRDIKPANILLTDNQEPKVSDFGLAKKLGDTDTTSTRTGTILGSPSYMPPEQAEGRISDIVAASDQYSIGATLYEMLTGRPPFVGPNVMETILQVSKRDPVPLRQLQPDVPIDLETICLKTLSKLPAARYQSCEELARDLERFLANEPILARPINTWEKSVRWCKRNPAIAGLSFTAIGLLLAITISSLWFSWTLNSKNGELTLLSENLLSKNIELTKSQEAEKASANLAKENEKMATERAEIAVKTIQILVKDVQEQLRDQPAQQELRRRILETARDKLTSLPDLPPSSDDQRELSMLALQQLLYTLEFELGHPERASNFINKAVEIAQSRVKKREGSDASRFNLAVILESIGRNHETADRNLTKAREFRERSSQILEEILSHPKATSAGEGRLPRTQVLLANAESTMQLATMNIRFGKPKEGLALFKKAFEYCELAAAEVDTDPLLSSQPEAKKAALRSSAQYNRVRAQIGMAMFQIRVADDPKAALQELIQLHNSLEVMASGSSALNDLKAGLLGIVVDAELMLDVQSETSVSRVDTCLQLSSELVKRDPARAEYQRLHALNYYRKGVLLERLGRTEESNAAFQESYLIRKALQEGAPDNFKWKVALMLASARLGKSDEARKFILQIEEDSQSDAETLVDAARANALVSLKEQDSLRREEDRKRCEGLLARARAQGYQDEFYLKHEPDLALLNKE